MKQKKNIIHDAMKQERKKIFYDAMKQMLPQHLEGF